MQTRELAKLLPQTKKQIEKLNELTIADRRFAIDRSQSQIKNRKSAIFLNSLVFFVSDEQQKVIEAALDSAIEHQDKTKAERKANALFSICQFYIDNKRQ